jgi:hypothetical protein
MSSIRAIAFALAGALLAAPAVAQDARPHNIILFIPDGLRALKVTPETAPTMAALRDAGVNFKNPHALFPPSRPPMRRALRPATMSATPAISATRSMRAIRCPCPTPSPR